MICKLNSVSIAIQLIKPCFLITALYATNILLCTYSYGAQAVQNKTSFVSHKEFAMLKDIT